MNLRKTVVSLFAATAFTMSLAAPVALAQDASQVLTSNVNEEGELTYGFSGLANAITFTSNVDTNNSDDVGPIYRGFVFNDTHAYSPGFSLQIEADDFRTGDGYTIDNENLTIGKRAPQPGSTDFCTLNNTESAVGGNAFQTISVLGTHVPATTPLSGPVTVLSGTEGRGCGAADLGVSYFLHVPAGTYTGGGQAVYTTDLTLTNTVGGGVGDGS